MKRPEFIFQGARPASRKQNHGVSLPVAGLPLGKEGNWSFLFILLRNISKKIVTKNVVGIKLPSKDFDMFL